MICLNKTLYSQILFLIGWSTQWSHAEVVSNGPAQDLEPLLGVCVYENHPVDTHGVSVKDKRSPFQHRQLLLALKVIAHPIGLSLAVSLAL